jgi:uncharacterized protein with PIN domain
MNENQVWFRFYEELNDFLPSAKRKTSFQYAFKENQSVKDAVEALGVPHVEVDMIIVNGKTVDFSYKLMNDDQISVYPVFESFDISKVAPLRAKPLRKTKFILDVHLGRLSKYLRLCGFDALFEHYFTDNEIIELSVKEHRIILTRDRGLLKNKRVTRGYWIRSRKPDEQLKEVLNRFDLKDDLHPFTRCLECNGTVADVPKEEIIDKLLPNTRNLFDGFKRCRVCGKIYWEGSHYERMKSFLESLITNNS